MRSLRLGSHEGQELDASRVDCFIQDEGDLSLSRARPAWHIEFLAERQEEAVGRSRELEYGDSLTGATGPFNNEYGWISRVLTDCQAAAASSFPSLHTSNDARMVNHEYWKSSGCAAFDRVILRQDKRERARGKPACKDQSRDNEHRRHGPSKDGARHHS